MATQVGTIDVLGREVEVHADTAGTWTLMLGGKRVGHGGSLDSARQNARSTLKRDEVKVEVPFVTDDGRNGVADGIHAKTRDVLATIAGKRESVGRGSNAVTFKPDIPDEVLAAYKAAHDREADARRERLKIEREWGMQLSMEVNAAIRRAAEDAARVEG